MIIFGKGISSGTVPLSGVVMKSSIANEVSSEKMWISTYGNHAVSSAAALEVLKIIEETDTQGNVKDLGRLMHKEFDAMCKEFPHHMKEIRGYGFFQAIEIAAPTHEESVAKTEKL